MRAVPSRKRLFAIVLAAGSALAQARQSARQETPAVRTQPLPQPAAQQSEVRTKISVNADLVVLPVIAKDRQGNLVPDLRKDEFRIFDDNSEQQTEVFTAEAFPLSLVVLIDDDLKSQDAAQMAPTLRAITAGIGPSDEALICRFDLSFYPGEGFAGDLHKLWADLKDAQDHSGPSTAGPVPWVRGQLWKGRCGLERPSGLPIACGDRRRILLLDKTTDRSGKSGLRRSDRFQR